MAAASRTRAGSKSTCSVPHRLAVGARHRRDQLRVVERQQLERPRTHAVEVAAEPVEQPGAAQAGIAGVIGFVRHRLTPPTRAARSAPRRRSARREQDVLLAHHARGRGDRRSCGRRGGPGDGRGRSASRRRTPGRASLGAGRRAGRGGATRRPSISPLQLAPVPASRRAWRARASGPASATRRRVVERRRPQLAVRSAGSTVTSRSMRSSSGPLSRRRWRRRSASPHVQRSSTPANPHGHGFVAATSMKRVGNRSAR